MILADFQICISVPLIGYILRNIFLEKWYTKCGGKTIPAPFFKKSKLSISLDQYSKVLYILFLLFAKFEDYRNWLKLNCRPPIFTSNKAFLKNKERSGTSLPASFSAWVLKKIISLVTFLLQPCLVAFTSWDIGQYVYCDSLLFRLWRNKS